MSKLNVLVLFGGVSTEHEVSCISAASILLNIDKEKYDIIPVGITKDGCWKLCDNCDIELIKNAKWADEKNLKKAVLSPDRKDRSLLVFSNEGIKAMPVDCVFAVIHGAMGEDGTLQGLFEISGIPYVGSGVCSSAMSMDKSVTKIIVSDLGIRQASYELVKYSNFLKNADNIITKTMLRLKGFPVFVKPASNGSSVGISRAKDKEELYKAIETAGKYDEKILVEEAIVGQEVEVAVLGTIDPVASVVGEVVPPDRFYDYKSKYIDDTAKLYIPARISNEAAEKLRVAAVKIFQALACSGLSRVDFFLRESDGEIVFNEINTMPGFTSISMYPKLFEASGIPYKKLIDYLIEYALEKN